MTCIIGLVDQKTKKLYIGGDSCGTSGWNVTTRADKKVFQKGDFIMGFTTSFRMGQILQYDFNPPPFPEQEEDVMKYMVSSFVKEVRNCLKSNGYAVIQSNQESGGEFLVGYKQRLFKIDNDFQLAESIDDIFAVGSGAQTDLGAMHALDLDGMSPEERIKRSLEITEKLNASVRAPFNIISI